MNIPSCLPARWPVVLSLLVALALPASAAEGDWVSLFDGKTLNGWKANESPASFKVVDGMIAGDGPRSHLYYVGDGSDGAGVFENFELEVEVLTKPHANSGVFFHAGWATEGWPTQQGFEAQVNNTQKPFDTGSATGANAYRENKKTGSLYGVRNIYKAMARDNEWFTMNVKVQRPRVQIRVNGVLVSDYVEPLNVAEAKVNRIDRGMFALQCHDPESKVFYRSVRVRRLAPGLDASVKQPSFDATAIRMLALAKDNFPLVDLHTHLKGDLTLERAMALSRATGMGLGIATNGGQGFPIQNDGAALAFLETMKEQAVFLALQAEGREWMKMFTRAAYSKFDYIFTDSMTWTNKAGKRLRLWIPEEADFGSDVEGFMDELTAETVRIIASEPIDIYVNPTFLPDTIAARADELWTEARMQKIIDAAVKHRVAIEINARYRIPSEKFIRMAKAAGAKFTIGTNNTTAGDFGDWSYPLEMQEKVGLTWRDLWVPGHEPSRAKRGL